MNPSVQGEPLTDPIGTVAGRVASEIGTALTTIEMAVDRLERQASDPGIAVHSTELSAIRTQSERLARLARQLLELARPPSAVATRLELGGEVKRTLALVRPEMGRQGIDLRFAPWGSKVEVQGDPMRLREALLALLVNAERAVRSGPDGVGRGWIEVQVIPGRHGGGEIRIRDSGPGVAEGEEEWIFVPFVSRWGGDGMGLTISRLSVAGQGGTLGVERDGEGNSEFVFRLQPFIEEAGS
jgi:signal transduction histidine kinase